MLERKPYLTVPEAENLSGGALNFSLFVEEGLPIFGVEGKQIALAHKPGEEKAVIIADPETTEILEESALVFNQQREEGKVSHYPFSANSRNLQEERFPRGYPEGYRTTEIRFSRPEESGSFWEFASQVINRYHANLAEGLTHQHALSDAKTVSPER